MPSSDNIISRPSPTMTQADLMRNGSRFAQRQLKSSRDVSSYQSPDSPSLDKLKIISWPGVPGVSLPPKSRRERSLSVAGKHAIRSRSCSRDREGRTNSLQPGKTDLTTMLNGHKAPERHRSSSLRPPSKTNEQASQSSRSSNESGTSNSSRNQTTSRRRRHSLNTPRKSSEGRKDRPSSLRSLYKDENEPNIHRHSTSILHSPIANTHNNTYKNRRHEIWKQLSERMLDRDHYFYSGESSYTTNTTGSCTTSSSLSSGGDFSGEIFVWRKPPLPTTTKCQQHQHSTLSPRSHGSNGSDRKKLSINRTSSHNNKNRPPRSPGSSFSSFPQQSTCTPPPRIPVTDTTATTTTRRPSLRRLSSMEKDKNKKNHQKCHTKDKYQAARQHEHDDSGFESSFSNSGTSTTIDFTLSPLHLSGSSSDWET